jgi:diguanylate cyclase (GGDEF)-like protein/PAS domain S-box-containing protein
MRGSRLVRQIDFVLMRSHFHAASGLSAEQRALDQAFATVRYHPDGRIADINPLFTRLTGYTSAELVGRSRAPFFSDSDEPLQQALRAAAPLTRTERVTAKSGAEIWLESRYVPLTGASGAVEAILQIASDATEQVTARMALTEALEQAKQLAHHDSATTLPNRVKLSAFLEANLTGPGADMVIFYIGIDRFKSLNDAYGHQVGDRVLAEMADRLRRLLREDQMIARVGGDEFVIAAPGLPMNGVERFCKRIYETVTAPIHHDGDEIIVGISMGVAAAPTDGTSPDDILRAADTALDRAKQNGRGQVAFYAREMNERIAAQRQLAEDMRHSLSSGHFYLEYQPRFDSRSGRIRSAEALVRWSHPERGRISPAEFIFLAERNGLIVPLGDWIMRTACQTAAAWGGIGISVNVSPAQFRDPTLIDKVKACLQSSGLPGSKLELEITEGVLIDDAGRATRILNELKTLGVKLALDDFGTGYSSLSYLRNFPFDVIKIDRSFINDLGSGPSARSIVQAIVALGKALGMSVTAEGVETDAQLAVLTADQCDEVQGFLLARPMAPEQVQGLIDQPPAAKKQALHA